MNKKTMVVACTAASLILATSACSKGSGSTTYEYKASGTVEGQQLDYDCPSGNIAMDSVAFVQATKKPGKSTPSPNTTGNKLVKATGLPTVKASSSTKAATASPSQSTSSPSTSSAPVQNKGVRLTEKPDSPEKIKKIPKVKYLFAPSGCEVEPEIFVRDKNGTLYEQDIRRVDYDKCLRAKVRVSGKKLFPLCTKG